MNQGILYAIGAYLLWGVFPIYWKLIQNVPASPASNRYGSAGASTIDESEIPVVSIIESIIVSFSRRAWDATLSTGIVDPEPSVNTIRIPPKSTGASDPVEGS